MTRNSLLKLPHNLLRINDISCTSKTLWIVPIGDDDIAIVRVIGDEPLDVVAYAKTLTYVGRTDAIISSIHRIGKLSYVGQVNTNLRFVLPPSSTHMDIAVES